MVINNNMTRVKIVSDCLNAVLIELKKGNDNVKEFDDTIQDSILCDYINNKYDIIQKEINELCSWIKKINWK